MEECCPECGRANGEHAVWCSFVSAHAEERAKETNDPLLEIPGVEHERTTDSPGYRRAADDDEPPVSGGPAL